MPAVGTTRYPELPDNVTLDEIKKIWPELLRALAKRDATPLPPAVIYGRNIMAGGDNFQDVTFVTAGTSLPTAPTPAYWNIYEYQIPRDAGMVLVEPVPVSSAARVQIQTFLPLANTVDSRTITIVYGNPTSVAFGTFNLAVFPTSGSSDIIIFNQGLGVTVNSSAMTTISATLNVSTVIQDLSGNSAPLNLPLYALTGPSTIGPVGATDISAGTLTQVRNNFNNTITGLITAITSVNSTATIQPALSYTFRSFGDKWVQIA